MLKKEMAQTITVSLPWRQENRLNPHRFLAPSQNLAPSAPLAKTLQMVASVLM
jgi:hypothetical protein